MNWDLVVSFYQIYCGEDFPASKLMCKVGNVPNAILVGDNPSILSTIVTTWPPGVFFLGDYAERRSQGYRNAGPCRCESSPRTQIWQFGGDPVLAAAGAKRLVVWAWSECDVR
jgi:hypothetical protein